MKTPSAWSSSLSFFQSNNCLSHFLKKIVRRIVMVVAMIFCFSFKEKAGKEQRQLKKSVQQEGDSLQQGGNSLQQEEKVSWKNIKGRLHLAAKGSYPHEDGTIISLSLKESLQWQQMGLESIVEKLEHCDAQEIFQFLGLQDQVSALLTKLEEAQNLNATCIQSTSSIAPHRSWFQSQKIYINQLKKKSSQNLNRLETVVSECKEMIDQLEKEHAAAIVNKRPVICRQIFHAQITLSFANEIGSGFF